LPEVKLDFEKRVRKSTDLTEKQYEEYQRSIRDLRDKYVAHRDLDWQAHVSQTLSFDKALRIAMQYECWLNDLFHKRDCPQDNSDSLGDIIKSAEGDVLHLTRILLGGPKAKAKKAKGGHAVIISKDEL
jgi:hypothetical protein